MDLRRLFGNTAEDEAAMYLEQQGYTILARQFKTKFGEIDLIAKDGDEVVFVEVKARTSIAFGYPEESVTAKKLEKITAAAHMYLKKFRPATYRIDVIAIEYKNGVPDIRHIQGVE